MYQIALLPGSFLTGFLLSPLLVLSRHISQLRTHRLKRPVERQNTRRLLASAFYGFAAMIVVGLVGTWAYWCLGQRNPWKWAILWILEGPRQWTRPVLLVYWILLVVSVVATWSRLLSRPGRLRRQVPSVLVESIFASPSAPSNGAPPSTNGFPPVGAEPAEQSDKTAHHISLNIRRKSFHALVVLMFVPSLIIDVSGFSIRVDPVLSLCAARLHTFLHECRLRSIHVLGIHSLFCPMAPWAIRPPISQRLHGQQG